MSKNLLNRNLIANSLNQMLGVGFPILIQYYLIRHLKLEDIGYWGIINSAKTIVLLSVSFFNIYLIKKFARMNETIEIRSFLSNSIVIMYIAFILPFVCFLIYMLYNYNFLTEFIIISSISIITTPLSIEFYFQATLKNDFVLYRRLFVKILVLILLFVFVKGETNFIEYACISSLSLSLEHIINFYKVHNFFSFKLVNKRTLRQIFSKSISYLPFNLSYNILPHLSIILGAYILNMKVLAVFSILFKLINLATTFITSTIMVLFPAKIKVAASQNSSFRDTKYLKNTIIVSFIVVIGLLLSRKLIFFIFLENHIIPNLDIEFAILCLYIFIHSTYNYLVFNYFLINNKSIYVTILNIVILVIFILELIILKVFELKILFSISIVIPPAIILCIAIYKILKMRKLINKINY